MLCTILADILFTSASVPMAKCEVGHVTIGLNARTARFLLGGTQSFEISGRHKAYKALGQSKCMWCGTLRR